VTNSLSNILYRVQMAPQEEQKTCVIDSNELVGEKIEERRREEKKRQMQALNSEDAFVPMDGESLDEDTECLGQQMPEEAEKAEPEIDYVAQAKEEADAILSEAREQADAILAEAGEQADAMRSHAEAEGQKEGYEQGLQEAAARQRELESRMQAEKEQLQADYDQKQKNMEHELVDVVCDVVGKVFLVQFGDKKEIIWHAVDQALANIEGSKEFMIRVGEANLEFLRAHKEELQEKVGQDMTLDIVLDPLLDETQCMIETDGGLFDCGMDTQMRNLIKDIKSLS